MNSPPLLALLERGAQRYQADDLPGASEAFRAALDLEPDEPRALFGLGIVDLKQGDWIGALVKGHQALRQAPAFAEGHHLVAQALRGQGNPRQAIPFYRQAQILAPSHADNVLRLGLTLAEVGELAEAAEWLQRFFVSEPLLAHRDEGAVLGTAHRLLGALWQQTGVLEALRRRQPAGTSAPAPGRRPTVLIICPRYLGGQRDRGMSAEYAVMVPPLEATGLADVVTVSPDDLPEHQTFETALFRTLSNTRVDAVVYTHRADEVVCRLELLRVLRATCDAPIVCVHTDSASPWNIWAADALTPLCDLHVALDSQSGFQTYSFCPWAYVSMWNPLDTRHFYRGTGTRDLDVCFIGSVEVYPQRKAALAFLRQHGVDVFLRAGGPGAGSPSLQEYADYFRRAKIVLNFSHASNNPDAHHLKGRVLEAMTCGALVLESANTENGRLFAVGRDYDTFADHTDLLAKIRHYLRHDAERIALADRGHATATSRYTAETFWRRILGHVGLGQPAAACTANTLDTLQY
ncbi:MAG: glycosyltransferase [Candidatus Binatia bacterium]